MGMSTGVNLRELAVERAPRDREPKFDPGSRWLTRWLLPVALVGGFAALTIWALWDTVSPRRAVTVVPVFTTRSATGREGTPLFKAAGWVEPRPTPIRVAALAPGIIERLLVVPDQAVSAGEIIAELVPRDAELARDRATSDLALRKAERASAETTLVAAKTRLANPAHLMAAVADADAALARVETELALLPSRISEATARHHYATERLGRVEHLTGGAMTLDAVEKIRSETESVEAELGGLERQRPALEQERGALQRRVAAADTLLQLKTAELQAVGESQAALTAATATVTRAEVAVADAELQLARMTVRAPVAGRVLELTAEPGSRVGAERVGQDGTTVVTMYQPESLQIRVDVRFEDLPKVVVGQSVVVESPALAAPLTGSVLYLTSRADIQKNTLAVKVLLDDAPSVLKPEMLVDVTMLAPVQTRDAALSERQRTYIPKRLVQTGEGGSFVWVADIAGGLAHRQAVETGTEMKGGLLEITRGLTAASRLIAGGREGLAEGTRITVTGEDSELGTDAPAP